VKKSEGNGPSVAGAVLGAKRNALTPKNGFLRTRVDMWSSRQEAGITRRRAGAKVHNNRVGAGKGLREIDRESLSKSPRAGRGKGR